MSNNSVLELLSQSQSIVSLPLIFLLSQAEVVSYLEDHHLLCRNRNNHPCIVESLKNIRVSVHSLSLSLETIEKAFQLYIQNISDIDKTSNFTDPIDIIDCILINFHCYSVNQECFNSEEIKMSPCNSRCLLHSFFNLKVSETLRCRCGSQWKNDWDSNNICQFFNTSSIFEEFDQKISEELLIYPKYYLRDERIKACNSLNYKGKLIQGLINRLKSATSGYCINDDCLEPESRVTFAVTNSPSWYIIDLIQENHEMSYLESFLSCAAIDLKAQINSIYGSGQNKNYRLEGVFFFNERLRFAELKGNYWKFPGLHSEATWYDVVKEALVMNLHPVSLIYKENRGGDFEVISDYKLKKLEQVAVQCEFFKNKYRTGFVMGEISGFFNEKKSSNQLEFRQKRLREIENNEKLQEDAQIFEKSRRNQEKSKNWKCSCGYINEDEFELCTKCNLLKIGVNKWICNKCSGLNEVYSILCAICGEGFKYESSLQSQEKPKHNFLIEDIYDTRQGINMIKNQIPSTIPSANSWVCKCNQINPQDYEVCIKCFELKPGISGWICKKCKFKNEEFYYSCSSCHSSKDGELKIEQTFWICEKCKSAISNETSFCSICFVYRNNSRLDTEMNNKCKVCFKNDIYITDKCYQCYLIKKEENKPTKEETNGESKWKCKYCRGWNNSWQSKCSSCSKFKDSSEYSQWTCSLCSKDNSITDSHCWYCRSSREMNYDKESIEVNCKGCGRNIEYVRCFKCGKTENFKIGYCAECKSDFSSINTCHNCYKSVDWSEYYDKYREPKPNNPLESSLNSVYKSFNIRSRYYY